MSRRKEQRIPLIERVIIPKNKHWTLFEVSIRIYLPGPLNIEEYFDFVQEVFTIKIKRRVHEKYGPHRTYWYYCNVMDCTRMEIDYLGVETTSVQHGIDYVTKKIVNDHLRERIETLYGSYSLPKQMFWRIPMLTITPAE